MLCWPRFILNDCFEDMGDESALAADDPRHEPLEGHLVPWIGMLLLLALGQLLQNFLLQL